ncbi:DsbA family protein [Streptomyces zingiberis]|uniref:Thioredoxin domain-containing protein n=1 Tax=Streptomyces zingiberis TaxID=2053010 RepID=A0ABX1BXT9_9ACTN|nr:thioredoxin domain-containing protein [Streptomyces zingiberis]NJQ01243.1 thioredoxin domain-containing protein [Streptomyces zingiberis]
MDTATNMRAADAEVREMVHRRRRRRRALAVSLGAVLAVAGAALVGAGLVRATNTAPDEAPSRVPTGAAAGKAGLAASTGAVRVDLYLDYLCPECRRTEQALATAVQDLVANGGVSVVHHPVAFLDDRSRPAGYSTRAASAAACAADEGKFAEYSRILFAEQPPEQGPGLGEAELVAAGREAGITGATFERCVKEARYRPWVRYVSDVAASRKVALTPTVMVEGRRIDVTGPDPAAALARAVTEARR